MALTLSKRKAVEKQPKPKAKKKPAGKKTFRATKGPKYVLFLGDEGAILLYIKGCTIVSRQFVPDASQQNLREFSQTIHKDTNAPIILVVDSMDQTFMQQTLPPVSSISVGKLIKKRLERDFGSTDIKGAIVLGREKTGRKDWNFMMVALEKSPQLSVWLEFIQDLPNRFVGIHLASVEAELILKHLLASMGKGKDEVAEWQFFVSHNKVGGFRQVILRNGRIVFTRLAQPLGESNPEVVAGSIEQEMLSTIEYMKRLSFSPQSKLDIIIITSSAIKSAIDPNKFNASSFQVMTPYDVAQSMRLEGAAQPTDQFGDVVTAAIIGCSRKHVLTMSTPQSKRVDQYYQFLLLQRLLAVLGVFGVIAYAAYLGHTIYTLNDQNQIIVEQKNTIANGLQALRQEIEKADLDVEKMSDLIDLYQQLQKEKLSPLPFIRMFEAIVPSIVQIKSLDWVISTEQRISRPNIAPLEPGMMPDPSAFRAEKKDVDVMVATLTLQFPPEASDPQVFKAVSRRVLEQYQAVFKGFEVGYTSLPAEVTENDRLEISSSKPIEIAPRSLDITMVIKGDLSLLDPPAETPQATQNPAIPQPMPVPMEQP